MSPVSRRHRPAAVSPPVMGRVRGGQPVLGNFLRACRRAAGLSARGPAVRVTDSAGTRAVRAAAFPISIDSAALEEIARREDVRKRTADIRLALDQPETLLLGIARGTRPLRPARA